MTLLGGNNFFFFFTKDFTHEKNAKCKQGFHLDGFMRSRNH